MNNTKHRSPFAIAARLIVLVRPMLPIMLAAIVMGVIGHFCATFITIFGGFAPNSVLPVNIRSLRFSYMALSTRKYSCSGPTVVRTALTEVWPKSFRMRRPCLLMACMERSSGVFLSSASPP